jgi:hypothetical protein
MRKIWVIYAHPTDFPTIPFVVREHHVDKGLVVNSELVHTGKTIENVRRHIPHGKQQVKRKDDDEPQIVEWWF